MRIARAVSDDWETFKAVRLEALRQSPGAFGSTFAEERDRPERWWRDWIGSGATSEKQVVFIAYDDDERPVGVVGAFRDTAAEARLIAMWVAPGVRRGGVGMALTRAVLEWATAVGTRRVILSVAEDNEPAANLYVRMGFVFTGAMKPLHSDPSRSTLEMVRQISE